MLAILVEQPGPNSRLRYGEVPDPQLRPNDVLVRTRAAGLNRADLSFRRGAYGDADWGDSPLMGLEIAGDIAAMGSEVRGWNVGDRVMSIVGGGAFAQWARVDHRMLMPIAPRMDYIQAAAIPEAFVTAHHSLCTLAELQKGETLLVHAAASGVGAAALQLARAIGARVIATASASKREAVVSLGADHFIDRNAEDFEACIASLTDSRGVNVILDFVGGTYFERNVRSLAAGGRLVQAGLISGAAAQPLPLERLLTHHLRIMGTVMKTRPLADKCAMTSRFAARWLSAFESGEIRPIVDRVYPVTEVEAAHRRLAANEGVGKIVLSFPG